MSNRKYDWYQKTTWTQADQDEFWKRLKRARDMRPQYLAIQSQKLIESGDKVLLNAGIGLAEFALKEYKHDLSKANSARIHLAAGLARTGRFDEALQHLRDAFEGEIAAGDMFRTDADMTYIKVIFAYQLEERFEDAHQVLLQIFERNAVPMTREGKFMLAGSMALLKAHKGESREAVPFARQALAESESNHSGIGHHPTLAMVPRDKEPYKTMIQKLKTLISIGG